MTGVVGMVVASPDSVGVHPDEEIEHVCAAVGAAGIAVRVVPWTAQLDWSQFEAVVLKSPWDYSMRSAEFSSWLAAVEGVTTVVNHPDLIRWNFDKRYLAELGACGVRVTPFVSIASRELARAEFARWGGGSRRGQADGVGRVPRHGSLPRR